MLKTVIIYNILDFNAFNILRFVYLTILCANEQFIICIILRCFLSCNLFLML